MLLLSFVLWLDLLLTQTSYMAFARAINPRLQAKEAWSWKITTPGILSHVCSCSVVYVMNDTANTC
jgi:hypothetical protein